MRAAIAKYQDQQNAENVDEIINDFFRQFKPKPRRTISEFAEEELYLTAGTSEKGRINLDRTPYIRGILDAVLDPEVHTIILITCSQIAKSTALNIICSYYIKEDPSDILFMQPTLSDAMDYSRRRLGPLFRDSPRMAELFDFKSKDAGNTILEKYAKNGATLTLVGSNSVSGISSKPIRILLADEIGRYVATKEGSNLQLAMKRTATFFNSKHIFTTTPGEKGLCPSEPILEMSDKRNYLVKCPHCGVPILYKWEQVVWDKDDDGTHHPETARYCCQECGVLLTDQEVLDSLLTGKWEATSDFNGVAGFCDFPEIYSPWVKMSETVAGFLNSKDDPDMLRVWVNTALGQYWEQENEKIDYNEIFDRREVYNLVVPWDACFLTLSADIQADRIEALVIAWGLDEEAWVMEHRIFYGDPSEIAKNLSKTDLDQLTFDEVSDFVAMEKVGGVWKALDDYRKSTWEHESGELLRISVATIDTGFLTDQVYGYIRSREREGVCAIKGQPGLGKPAVDRPSRKNKGKVRLYNVGTFTVKDSMQARLRKKRPGPGYIHFPDRVDKEFCEQVVSEKKVIKEIRGKKSVEWMKIRQRNEGWDLLCYGFAALRIKFSDRDKLNIYCKRFHDRINDKQQNVKSSPAFRRRVISRGVDNV